MKRSGMHLTPEPKFRWENSFRQEALDFHCLKFGLLPATTNLATEISDPLKMSPRLWIERGYPHMIHIDWTIPCDRRNPLDVLCAVKLACPPLVPRLEGVARVVSIRGPMPYVYRLENL